ncbi:MAG TPA: hypothetical protein VLX58_12995 [Bryobacteraceae bacterium]|nr:hypothetical protein [Bryobacteraceae bacterium]
MRAAEPGRCAMIGLAAEEIEWIRLLVKLLRDPDPVTRELVRQALAYVENLAGAGWPAAPPMRVMR